MKTSTIRGIHSILSGAFAAAQRWEWTNRNPPAVARLDEITGCRPETWRRSTAVTGRSANPVPHRPRQAGSWPISRSGLAACVSAAPLCLSCPRGVRPPGLRSDRGFGAGLAGP